MIARIKKRGKNGRPSKRTARHAAFLRKQGFDVFETETLVLIRPRRTHEGVPFYFSTEADFVGFLEDLCRDHELITYRTRITIGRDGELHSLPLTSVMERLWKGSSALMAKVA